MNGSAALPWLISSPGWSILELIDVCVWSRGESREPESVIKVDTEPLNSIKPELMFQVEQHCDVGGPPTGVFGVGQ